MRKLKAIGAGQSEGPGKFRTIPVDQVGIWTSTLCVIHCLVTPIVLSISAVSAHFLPSEERTHRILAVVIGTLGAACSSQGLSKPPFLACAPDHDRWVVLHFRGRILGGPTTLALGRSSHYAHWERIHDRRSQNESHLLSRLQLRHSD
jgi:hypothetical protein